MARMSETSPVCLVIWSVWSIWLVSYNQTNQTDPTDQMNKTGYGLSPYPARQIVGTGLL